MQAVTLSKSLHISSLSACLSLIMPCYCISAGLQPGHISAQPLQILQNENLFYTAPSFIFLKPVQCVVQFCTCGKVLYRLSTVFRGSRKSIKHTTTVIKKLMKIHIIRSKCCQLESTYLKEIDFFITIQVSCRNQG
jgi:hypothetical protein